MGPRALIQQRKTCGEDEGRRINDGQILTDVKHPDALRKINEEGGERKREGCETCVPGWS